MMKRNAWILSLLMVLSLSVFAQKRVKSGCEELPDLATIIKTDTTRFSNLAQLYWQYNCDSAWLTYEKNSGEKFVLNMLDGADEMEMWDSVGWHFKAQTQDELIFNKRNNADGLLVSEYYLVNKENAQQESIGALFYMAKDKNLPILASFTTNAKTKLHDSVSVYHLNTKRRETYDISVQRLDYKHAATITTPIEKLVEKCEVKDNLLIITYRYKEKAGDKAWITNKIYIDIERMIQ